MLNGGSGNLVPYDFSRFGSMESGNTTLMKKSKMLDGNGYQMLDGKFSKKAPKNSCNAKKIIKYT